MREVEKAMAGLTPAGVAFANFLHHRLIPAWETLKRSVQQAVLPGVQAGLEALMPYAPQITAFATSMGEAMGGLVEAMGEDLTSERWRPFFRMLADLGPDTLTTIGHAFGDIANGIANLAVAFAPLSVDFINGFANMAQSFADWSAGLSENDGFQSFLAYIRDNAPRVFDFLDSLIAAGANIVRALAPFGLVVLDVLTGIADFVAGMDPETLGGIVLAFVGLAGSFRAINAALGALRWVRAHPLLFLITTAVG